MVPTYPSRLLKSELQAWLRGRLSGNTEAGLTIMNVSGGDDDLRWDAYFAAMLESGPAYERRSRYGDKPALFIEGREIAHLEARGVIALRITRQGWSRARDGYGGDPAVRHDPSRRDWIELHLRSPADLDHLAGLLVIAAAENA
jgi:Family of unknown function (DUF5519)